MNPPELWVSPSGKIHRRRKVWYPGTPDERTVVPTLNIMLCGQRRYLRPAPKGAEVSCGTCRSATK